MAIDEEVLDTAVATEGVDIEEVEVEQPLAESDEQTEDSAPAEQATEEEPSHEPDDGVDFDDEDPDTVGNKKGGFQRKLERVNQENALLKAQLQALTGLHDKVPEQAPKPTVDDFEDYDSYLEAASAWHADNAMRARQTEVREHTVRAQEQLRAQEFIAQRDAFAQATPDYNEVLKSVDDIAVPPAVQQALLAVDNSPALMYALAKERDTLAELATMNPLKAALRIGALSAELSKSKSNPSAPKVTQAKPPIRTAERSGNAAAKSVDDMSFDEYKAWASKNIRSNR